MIMGYQKRIKWNCFVCLAVTSMLSKYAVQVKGILFIAKLFGDEYVRNHRFSGCNSLSYDYSEDEAYYFVGFEENPDDNKWDIYAYVAVNKKTGEVRFLDFRLPSGIRMKNPSHPVIYA